MATGRIGVTPVLRTRWSKLPTTGTTVLSGLDDNSVALVYDAGYEAVYRNGVLLSRGNDYTATNGTTVTLIDATLAGDVVEVFANDLVPLTDAISKGQYNAKGALLSATAASTPAVLAVGTNDQVLTADSTTSTGLKWATASAGGTWAQVATGSLTGASVTISSLAAKNDYLIVFKEYSMSANSNIRMQFNNDTNDNYYTASDPTSGQNAILGNGPSIASGSNGYLTVLISGCNTTQIKRVETTSVNYGGMWNSASAISSITLFPASGSWDNGTYYIWSR
jgi:hypothetical protein